MSTLAEIVDDVYTLSMDELQIVKRIVDRQLIESRRLELRKAADEAIQEHKDGKTTVLGTPEEIRKYFTDLIENNDLPD